MELAFVLAFIKLTISISSKDFVGIALQYFYPRASA